jgi:hypothetical protein
MLGRDSSTRLSVEVKFITPGAWFVTSDVAHKNMLQHAGHLRCRHSLSERWSEMIDNLLIWISGSTAPMCAFRVQSGEMCLFVVFSQGKPHLAIPIGPQSLRSVLTDESGPVPAAGLKKPALSITRASTIGYRAEADRRLFFGVAIRSSTDR